jgi:hypothetical protein
MGGKSHHEDSIPDRPVRSSVAIPTELLGQQISPVVANKGPFIGWSYFGLCCSTGRDLNWRDVKYIKPLKPNDQ